MTEVIGGFESTYLPAADADVMELTGHADRWREELEQLHGLGVRRLRYPVRWHRVEPEPGRRDWRHTDEVMAACDELGLLPIVDLVHHTSHPRWLAGGFGDRRFADAYLDYATELATRYPQVREYTLFNEPFATLFLAGHEALWPPYGRGTAGLVRVLRTVLPAVVEAGARYRELLPDARHVWVDTCEAHTASAPQSQAHAELANDRRFAVLDLVLGHDLDPSRPFLRELVEAGGADLLELPRAHVDVLGLDYYAHSEWHYDADGGYSPSPCPAGLAALAETYWQRYRLPMMLSETNIRGLPSDRVSWLRYVLEQYEQAVASGVPLDGLCWFPVTDSRDWDSLLARAGGRRDPVGVLPADGDGAVGSDAPDGARVAGGPDGAGGATSMTRAYALVAAGGGSADLPAYRFQHPLRERLSGYDRQLAHWPWQDPPAEETQPAVQVSRATSRARGTGTRRRESGPAPSAPALEDADLVVLSHLRWPWVWQRPQHLVSRLAGMRAAAGRRTWFVEEPVRSNLREQPAVVTEQRGDVTRLWLEVPGRDAELVPFMTPGTECYAALLAEALGDAGAGSDVWLYTPMALDLGEALRPRLLVYDVMDDLSSFAQAPPGLLLRQRRALAEADVVFAGGRSLHRSVAPLRGPRGAHLFPSGVETGHYARARTLRGERPRPVAGYVGVVDERIDLPLLAETAARLPGWDVQVVGPVTKIDPADLPQAPNIAYLGLQPYDRLPEVMAGFDVALMPFARNEATRSISPTKTLEYLAAGLPVVSTSIPDVVADFGDVVHLADDAGAFSDALVAVSGHDRDDRDARVAPVQARHEWDAIARDMSALMADALGGTAGSTDQEESA